MSRTGRGALLMCLSMGGFAAMDAISKLMVQTYPVVQALWIRYVVFAVFALFIAGPAGLRRLRRTARPWLQFWRAALALLENGVFVLAFAFLPLAEAHAIAATSPLIVILLAAAILRERIGLHRQLAVLAGFAGVLLIIRPGFGVLDLAMLLPLAGAVLWALYQVLTRLTARGDPPETTLLWSALIGLALISLPAPFAWRPPDALGWGLLLAIGVLGSLAHYALIRALDQADASAMQPFGYTLPVWATVMGLLVFGDVPAVWTVIGGGVVVVSGLYSWRQDRRRG